MSYICDGCDKTYRDEAPNKVVTKKRPVHYKNTIVGEKDNRRRIYASGLEIKEELELCGGCVGKDEYDMSVEESDEVKVVTNKDYVNHKV